MAIRTIIFDLDGTLVKTERLKAISYARAAKKLRPDIDEDDVIEAYKDVVGRSRKDVATTLLERFHLEEASRDHMQEHSAKRPWQAYVGVRLEIYHRMVDDPEVITENVWPEAVSLVRETRNVVKFLALATTSRARQTERVLGALGLRDRFDLVVTADDVDETKPDPESYELVVRELDMKPEECLAIEDSPSGVSAAVNAGIPTIAALTEFTSRRIRERDWPTLLDIVEERKDLRRHVLSQLAG